MRELGRRRFLGALGAAGLALAVPAGALEAAERLLGPRRRYWVMPGLPGSARVAAPMPLPGWEASVRGALGIDVAAYDEVRFWVPAWMIPDGTPVSVNGVPAGVAPGPFVARPNGSRYLELSYVVRPRVADVHLELLCNS